MTLIAPTRESPAAPVEHAATLHLDGVVKRFGHGPRAVVALQEMSFAVRRGEFVCVLGASGGGKSTLLNLIAGLDRPTAGTVQVEGGQPALMFQDAALFPWLTVEENIGFPLRMHRVSSAERRERVASLLRLVHLDGTERRRPHELSGGMRQRVALARALAQGGDLLLMDEPFGALDALLRDCLHGELERIWQETGRTILFVTHDVREAVRLAGRVLVLSRRPGRVAADIPVPLDRPRRLDDPAVAALTEMITARLRREAAPDDESDFDEDGHDR
jgi:NitT/TauT family transport system ATP-binding protein